MTESSADDCPCGGKHWADWHRNRGLPMCDQARRLKAGSDQKADRRRKATVRWIPGTPIAVPEVDPL